MEKWLSTWSIGQKGSADDFARIKDAGFTGVEIWAEQIKAGEYLDFAKETGLKVSVHLPFHDINLATPDRAVKERALAVLSEWIERISDYGGYHATIHGGYAWSSEEREETLARVKDRLVFLGEKASLSGVELSLENLIPDRLNYCHYIASNVDEWVNLIKETNVKVCLDTGHLAVMGNELSGTVERLGDSLAAIHLSDNDRHSDLHLLPGEGDNIANGLIGILEKRNFKGPIVYEINPYKYTLDDICRHLSAVKEKI